jgi:hypothetical protein
MQKSYVEQANKLVKIVSYAEKYKSFPPKDGFEAVPLNDAQNRKAITSEVSLLIENYGLEKVSQSHNFSDFNKIIMEIALAGEKSNNTYRHVAGVIIATINVFEKIAGDYHKLFPKSKEMFEMVNTLGKLIMPIMNDLYDGDMPLSFRKTFPRSSSIFENYIASRVC